MATYVISDIHGEYDQFMDLLNQIRLQDDDVLYILGDILDRGARPITTLFKIMEMPNAVCIAGNHEIMALKCLPFLAQEVTEEAIKALDNDMVQSLLTWNYNGCDPTLDEFHALPPEEQQKVIDFLGKMPLYERLTVAGKEFILVHGGLGGFDPEKRLEDYSEHDLVWERPDYSTPYFPDIYVVTGHTPTQIITCNPRPGYIFQGNQHIAIDCGAYFSDGRLAAICLDTGREYYSL